MNGKKRYQYAVKYDGHIILQTVISKDPVKYLQKLCDCNRKHIEYAILHI